MIFQRYVVTTILQGTLLTLGVLVSISAFFTFVAELGDIGINDYGFYESFQFVLLKIPGQIVFSLPISVFIGAILGLGTLSSHNEIVVMQAAGMSVLQFIFMVLKAGFIIAIISMVLQQWVISETESIAEDGRTAAKKGLKSYSKNKSVWIKEGDNVIYINQLNTSGGAEDIQIYQFNKDRRLAKAIRATTAKATSEGWKLNDVYETVLKRDAIETNFYSALLYPVTLSEDLLKSMRMKPVEMSLTDLYQYQVFLDENGLESEAEQVMFWRRMYSPLMILVICSFAVPFVLTSQRDGQSGKRIMIGVMVGLSFVAIDRLVVIVCQYVGMMPQVSTLMPLLIFLLLNVILVYRVTHLK